MLHHFQGRDFLKLADYTPEEVGYLVDTAIELKRRRAMGELFEPLRGKTIALIFEKLSTRTRVSFQAGAAQLGAQTFYMSPDQMQTSRGEPIRDTARIIDRYCDAPGDADVIYGNTWHSMATEDPEQRVKDFGPYRVNMRVIEMAKPDVIYMHCLPGYRGEDMVDEVIESKYCVFWDQGENRMHTEKAVLALTLA